VASRWTWTYGLGEEMVYFDEVLKEVGNLYATCTNMDVWKKLLEILHDQKYFEARLTPEVQFFEKLSENIRNKVKKVVLNAWRAVLGESTILSSSSSEDYKAVKEFGVHIIRVNRAWSNFLKHIGIPTSRDIIYGNFCKVNKRIRMPTQNKGTSSEIIFKERILKDSCS